MGKITAILKPSRIEKAMGRIAQTASTDKTGDGKIFVSSIEEVVRIRTGERGEEAI